MVKIDLDDPGIRTFMLFMQLSSAAEKYANSYFYKEQGLSMITFISMKGIILNGGSMTHSELANFTNTKKHNITALVQRMKQQNLVTTERSKTDTRIIYIKITDVGREVYEKASPTGRSIMGKVMNGFNQNDINEFERLLTTIKENLEKNK